MKTLKRYARKSLAAFPFPARAALYRSLVDIDPVPHPSLTVKVAQTNEELEAAFRLLHDTYVESGYMSPDPSGLRVTGYHALPGTRVIIASLAGQVVGTTTMIPDSPFGLPMDEVFDLDSYRRANSRIMEVSGAAVRRGMRGQGGRVLFVLLRYMAQMCIYQFQVDQTFMCMHPRSADLYRALFGAGALDGGRARRYSFAGGAPAVGIVVDWEESKRFTARKFGGRSRRKDLYRYMVQRGLDSFPYPSANSLREPALTPEQFHTFFRERTNTIDQLPAEKVRALRSLYRGRPHMDLLGDEAWEKA